MDPRHDAGLDLAHREQWLRQPHALVLLSKPEVVTVVSQHGRPDDGTDTAGFYNAEFFVPLKPPSEWTRGLNKEEITKEVIDKLEADFPGVDFNASQNIQDNVEEAASGVKGENSVKLFGNNLEEMTKTAFEIKEVLNSVEGITDLAVLTSLGQPSVTIKIDRLRPRAMDCAGRHQFDDSGGDRRTGGR